MRHISYNALWNMAGNGLPLLVGLLTIPALLHSLGDERFGLLTIAWATLGYFSLFDLGIGRATTKYVAEHWSAGRELEAARVVHVALLVLGFFGVLAALSLVGVVGRLAEFLNVGPDFSRAELENTLWLITAAVPLILLTAAVRGTLEGQQRFRLVNLIRLPANVAMFLVPYLLASFHRVDLITLALVVSRLVVLLAYVWGAWSLLRARPFRPAGSDWAYVRQLLSYGGWVFLAASLGSLMSMGYLDRFLLGGLRSVAEIAYYATPMEMMLRLLIIPGAIVAALFPVLGGGQLADESARHLCRRGIDAITWLVLPLIICVVALGHDLLSLWIDEAFAGHATMVMHLLAVGLFFNAVAHVPYTYLQATGRPGRTAMRHVVELPFYVSILWFLVLNMGAIGAALTWMIWAFVDMLLLFWLANRVVPTVIELPDARGLLGIFLVALLAFFISFMPGLEWRVGGVSLLIVISFVAWRMFSRSRETPMLVPLFVKRIFVGVNKHDAKAG